MLIGKVDASSIMETDANYSLQNHGLLEKKSYICRVKPITT